MLVLFSLRVPDLMQVLSAATRSFLGGQLWDMPLFPFWSLPVNSACQIFEANPNTATLYRCTVTANRFLKTKETVLQMQLVRVEASETQCLQIDTHLCFSSSLSLLEVSYDILHCVVYCEEITNIFKIQSYGKLYNKFVC